MVQITGRSARCQVAELRNHRIMRTTAHPPVPQADMLFGRRRIAVGKPEGEDVPRGGLGHGTASGCGIISMHIAMSGSAVGKFSLRRTSLNCARHKIAHQKTRWDGGDTGR